MSLLEHMAYDNNQASVLVVSHLEYICTQQFEYLKRLRAHFMHIDLALFVKYTTITGQKTYHIEE